MTSRSAACSKGNAGAYSLRGDIDEVNVPATLQATIGARIDRLDAAAKRTLNAAAVIGSRFDAELLSALVDDARRSTADRGRTGRPGELRFPPPVRVSAPVDPRGRERIATANQIARNCTGVWHRSSSNAIRLGRCERGHDRGASRGGGRAARSVRMAHARRSWVNYRDNNAAHENVGAGRSRSPTDCPKTIQIDRL